MSIIAVRRRQCEGIAPTPIAIAVGVVRGTAPAKVAVTGVMLPASIGFGTGSTFTLTPVITPANATDKTVTYSSDNTAVATVDALGVVKGMKAGRAIITATAKDGGKTAKCTVTVTAAPKYAMQWPLKAQANQRINSRWGWRNYPEEDLIDFHRGLDIYATIGTPVYAAMEGEVVDTPDWKSAGGLVVILKHEISPGVYYYSWYLHLSKQLVKENDKVTKDTIIAYSGNTGGVPAHLHFEISPDKDRKNHSINPILEYQQTDRRTTQNTGDKRLNPNPVFLLNSSKYYEFNPKFNWLYEENYYTIHYER
jgi:murein DD-endopeptidase MepM/ murein hydrolase activator NlpD